MAITSGKTIDQLNQIDNVNGKELIPMAVLNEVTNKYHTVAVTLDNFLKMVNIRISYNMSYIESLKEYTTAYIEDLSLKTDDLSYTSYSLSYGLSNLSSYTHESFARNDEVDKRQDKEISYNKNVNVEQASYIDYNLEMNSYQQSYINALIDNIENPFATYGEE